MLDFCIHFEKFAPALVPHCFLFTDYAKKEKEKKNESEVFTERKVWHKVSLLHLENVTQGFCFAQQPFHQEAFTGYRSVGRVGGATKYSNVLGSLPKKSVLSYYAHILKE